MPTAESLFGRGGALVGMVHVAALPGTPRHRLSMDDIVRLAVDDARTLAEAGFDAILIENMHDVPYLRGEVGPEIVAGMTRVTDAVRVAVDRPIGVQILAGANTAALAVAHTCGGGFVRAEGFVFAAVADEGLLDRAEAGPLLRERRRLDAEGIAILADVKKKHSAHAITADVGIEETAEAAVFCGADAIVISGTTTGAAVDRAELAAVRVAVNVPVIVGSGVTPDDASELLRAADALIVGSWIKRNGSWSEPVDAERAAMLVRSAGR